jgi:hypothetical protein
MNWAGSLPVVSGPLTPYGRDSHTEGRSLKTGLPPKKANERDFWAVIAVVEARFSTLAY